MSLIPFIVLYKTPDEKSVISAQALAATTQEDAIIAVSDHLNNTGLGDALILGVFNEVELNGLKGLIDELKEKLKEMETKR